MSIPGSMSIETPDFIERVYDHNLKQDKYKLLPDKLSQDECHIIFPMQIAEEMLIVTALEFMTFHPSNKEMNDKYKCSIVKCGKIGLFLCSVPKEFRQVCENAGKVFGMTMKTCSRMMLLGVGSNERTMLEIPKHEILLNFEGKRCYNEQEIDKRCEEVRNFGNWLEKQKLD